MANKLRRTSCLVCSVALIVVMAPAASAASPPVRDGFTARGTFLLPGGSTGASGLRVTVILADVGGAIGDHSTLTLGTTTTDADGTWLVPLASPLPRQAQARADGNDGVLNVLAIATGETSNGVVESGVEAFALGVGKSTGATDASRSAAEQNRGALRARMQVVPASAQRLPGLKTSHAVSGDSESRLAGHDYANTLLVPDVTSCTPGIFYTKHISTTGAYTVAGEAHAYYDALASFTYSTTASTDISAGVSYNFGSTFSIGGTYHMGNTTTFLSGFSRRGPDFGYQWKIPVLYSKDEVWEKCNGGDQYDKTTVTPQSVSAWTGGATGVYGANVLSKDGPTAYLNSDPAYRALVVPNSVFGNVSGRMSTYSGAASIFGFSVTATSSYGTTREQRIETLSGTSTHDIWGARGLPASSSDLVFYSF